MEYADDVDNLDEEKKPPDHLQSVAAEKLKVHNLFINETRQSLVICTMQKQ